MDSDINAARKILREVFGYDDFRAQQAAIIHSVQQGSDALVLMPTGGGKSLCYQIPALLRNGVGVVISPLIALMQDQVDALNALGIRAAFINSSLSGAAMAEVESSLLAGELDLLYMAPERLLMPAMLQRLERCPIALFAIDEAHCVSQWGHDFRREYLELSVLHELFPNVPRIALTATADQRTRDEIVRNLALEQAGEFISSFDRPNIRYAISQPQQPRTELLRFLEHHHRDEAGIVYCLSRRKVEQTAEWLQSEGYAALPYHAGLDSATRAEHQSRFLREDGLIVVATIAFGMGIDKPDVRFVAHLDLPKSVEAYYQETGRAGRDGLPANAWMAYGLQNVINLRAMLAASDADEAHRRVEQQKLNAMLGLAEMTTCRRQALLRYFGDHLAEPCGNCDNCLSPPDTFDATEAAQKALSCAYRTGQRFGVNYLIDVLLGKTNERQKKLGHDQLSTFGIGTEYNAVAWRNIYRQLLARGLLAVDAEGHGSLQLTELARPVLKGEQTLNLRPLPETGQRERRPTSRRPRIEISVADQPLWEALRELRRELSSEQGVPAYVVFNDQTLLYMVEHKPQDLEAFTAINGVGQHKLEQYGERFVSTIREVVNRLASV